MGNEVQETNIHRRRFSQSSRLPELPKKYTEIGAKRAAFLKGKKYRTRNYMAMTEKENNPNGVTNAILKIVSDFEEKYAKKWKGRHISRPADIERYMLWLYATGSRKREPFHKPYPRINVFKPKDLPWRVVHIIRVIEKSFVNGTKDRVMHEQYIPIFDVAEDKVWRKVLSDYENTDLDDLFQRLEVLDKNQNLTGVIQRNFHCDMREELTGKLLKNAPLTPHALRHHRAYNLYIERGLDKDLVISLFGWKDDRMLDYYAYINRGAKGRAQLHSLKKFAESEKKRS